jgi:hypothetical protein
MRRETDRAKPVRTGIVELARHAGRTNPGTSFAGRGIDSLFSLSRRPDEVRGVPAGLSVQSPRGGSHPETRNGRAFGAAARGRRFRFDVGYDEA